VLLRREIGRQLRDAREAAGFSLTEAAPLLDTSSSSLNRIENGLTRATVHIVRSMMDVYNARLDDLLELVRESRKNGWWAKYGILSSDFVALEAGAAVASDYELSFVPGLLQTADYARALFEAGREPRGADWIQKQSMVRLIRQERLTDADQPLRLEAVIHEFALHHPVGGAEVMRAQLRHLALVTELPTVTLRVLPAAVTAKDAMRGGFTVLDFPNNTPSSVVHLEHALAVERWDKEQWVTKARMQFDHLRSLALSPADSVALIERLAEQSWSG
jgi:transcriptional regulator with XRE-family HTH domain